MGTVGKTCILLSALAMIAGCGDAELAPRGSLPADTFIQSSGPADLTTMESARHVFELSHPSTSLEFLLAAMFLTDFAAEAGECPMKVDESTETTIDTAYFGGCTNEGATSAADDDQSFAGNIQIQGRPDDYEIAFNNFVISSESECGSKLIPERLTINGTVQITEGYTADDVTYKVNVLYDADTLADARVSGGPCETDSLTYGFSYTVRIEHSGADTDGNGTPDELVTFTGSGAMASLEVGAWTTTAQLQHSSIDELADGTECNEPLSGEITVAAGDHTAKLFADGANECTIDACARWELDGTLQPTELCGVRGCALTGIPDGRNPSAVIILLLLGGFALAWSRRH